MEEIEKNEQLFPRRRLPIVDEPRKEGGGGRADGGRVAGEN